MTTLSVANKVKQLGIGITNGPEDLDYLIRRKKKVLSFGPLVATSTFTGCVHYFEKAARLRGLIVSDMTGVLADVANFMTITIGYNDGAGGGITDLGHWSSETGTEGSLTALHMETMAGVTDLTAIAAGKYLTATLTSAGAGVATHLVVEVQYEEVG